MHFIPIATVDRDKSEDYNDIDFMAFELKEKVLNCQRKRN